MNTELIFYVSRRTGESEEALNQGLSAIGIDAVSSSATIKPADLCYALSGALSRVDLVFIIGGLSKQDTNSTPSVLTKALGVDFGTAVEQGGPVLLLKNAEGTAGGYILESGSQSIILLPDDPEQIALLCRQTVLGYLKSKYTLTEDSRRGEIVQNLELLEQRLQEEPLIETPESAVIPPETAEQPTNELPQEKPKGGWSKAKKIILIVAGSIVALIFIACAVVLLLLHSGKLVTSTQNAEFYSKLKLDSGFSVIHTGTNLQAEFEPLLAINSDVGGWLTINGTSIDYPVMKTAPGGTDYSSVNFRKQPDHYGTPHFDSENLLDGHDKNTVIDAQNYEDGAMFSPLENYRLPGFYDSAPVIQLDTLNERGTWAIFSVCIVDSRATNREFNYRQTYFDSEDAFAKHIQQLNIRSIIETGVPVSTYDRLLTLVTPTNDFEGSVLVVTAKLLNDQEKVEINSLHAAQNEHPLMSERWYGLHGGIKPVILGAFDQYLGVNNTASSAVATSQTSSAAVSTAVSSAVSSQAPSSQAASSKPPVSSAAPSSKPPVSSSPPKPQEPMLTITTNGHVETNTRKNILARIVEAEMGQPYSMEALKAQAVASYTYLQYQYSIGVKAPWAPTKYASSKAISAVNAVDGIKMTYNGKPIYAAYFAASPGVTDSNANVFGRSLPYLVPVDSSIDKTYWKYKAETVLSAADFKSQVSSLGVTLPDDNPASWVSITHDADVWPESYPDIGFVRSVTIGGQSYSGTKIQDVLGLRSHCYTIRYVAESNAFTIITLGNGHCVGMSQYGANQMAVAGSSYTDILTHYYTGITIQ